MAKNTKDLSEDSLQFLQESFGLIVSGFWLSLSYQIYGVDGLRNILALDGICTIIGVNKDGHLTMDLRGGLRAF